MEVSQLKSILESLLFVSGEPIKISKLSKICGAKKDDILTALDELNQYYQGNERGFAILQKEDNAQLVTNPSNAEYVSQLVSNEINSDLTRSALEVLSIIAYREPITRVQIEAIRGVNCSYVLRNLLLKGLVERTENQDIRGYLYETSFDFLKTLGISSAKKLPDWEKLSQNEKIEELLVENSNQPDSKDAGIPEDQMKIETLET
jgi:segregation and condensation protein B